MVLSSHDPKNFVICYKENVEIIGVFLLPAKLRQFSLIIFIRVDSHNLAGKSVLNDTRFQKLSLYQMKEVIFN